MGESPSASGCLPFFVGKLPAVALCPAIGYTYLILRSSDKKTFHRINYGNNYGFSTKP
ncbi:MAG: hypothetical protein LBU34_15835 [Planctomycetaceae bacterium]|nr:hypothetical protein [Planctomycetaceae bacterium]